MKHYTHFWFILINYNVHKTVSDNTFNTKRCPFTKKNIKFYLISKSQQYFTLSINQPLTEENLIDFSNIIEERTSNTD